MEPEETYEEEERYCDFGDLLPSMACDAYTFYLEHYRLWIEGWLIELFEQEILTDVSAQYLIIDDILLDIIHEDMEESWEIYGN